MILKETDGNGEMIWHCVKGKSMDLFNNQICTSVLALYDYDKRLICKSST